MRATYLPKLAEVQNHPLISVNNDEVSESEEMLHLVPAKTTYAVRDLVFTIDKMDGLRILLGVQ
jgi:hypothetical protein